MPLFVGAIDGGGDQPTAPGTPVAVTGQDASTTVAFDPPSYIGKGTVSYVVTSSPGGITRTGNSPVAFTGLTNGVSYTFTVVAVTDYGVSSPPSAASSPITPSAPPPPPNPCAGCPAVGTLLGSGCNGYTLYYAYADGCCGVGSTTVIEYNSPTCGYNPPPPPPPGCTDCVYTVTGSETFTCGCVELPGGYKQKVFYRTYFSTSCLPNPCTGCSCPSSNDSACVVNANLVCYSP